MFKKLMKIQLTDKNITMLSLFITSSYVFVLIACSSYVFNESDLAVWFSLLFLLNIKNFLDFGLSNNILRSAAELNSGLPKISQYKLSQIHTLKIKDKNLINKNLCNLYKNIKLYRFIQFVIFLFPLFFIVKFFFNERLLNVFEYSEINLIYSFVFLSLFFSISSMNSMNFRIGIGNLYKARLLEIYANLLKMILLSMVILIFKNIYLFVMLFLILDITYFIFNDINLKKEINYSKYCSDLSLRIGFTRLLPNLSISGINSISAFFLFQFLNLISIKFGTDKDIISYSIISRFVNIFKTISFSSISSSLMRYANNRVNNKTLNKTLFFSDLKFCLKLYVSLSLAFLLIIIFIKNVNYYNFLNLEDYLFSLELIIFYLILNLFELHQSCHNQFLLTKNYNPFLITSFVSSSLIAIFSYIFFPIYGFLGAFLVQFIIQLCINHWYSVYLNRNDLGFTLKNYLKNLVYFKL